MPPQETRKPCDQCFRRKVRCNYESPCNRCRDTHLSCTHSIVRKKRGPRKGKGAVLDHLRANSNASRTPPDRFDEELNDVDDEGGVPGLSPLAHDNRTASSASFRGGEVPPTSRNAPVVPGADQHISPVPLNREFDVPQQPTYESLSSHHPVPTSMGYGLPQEPLLDDSFLTFDEFAHNVLADSSYFAFEPAPNVLGDPSNLPPITPLDSGTYGTPQTALVPTLVVPEDSDGFEVTPIVERAVQLFFEHLHPTYAVISKDMVVSWLQAPNILLPRSDQVLVWSICACSLVLVDDWPNLGTEQRAVFARRFIRKCRQLRIEWDYEEGAGFHDVLASLFIANTYFELKCRKSSWTFVREAITLASIAGLHDEKGYLSIEDHEQVQRRRCYALLYVTERGGAILDGFPVSIFIPPPLPNTILPGEDPTIISGLLALHSLFCLLDFKFVRLWNDQTHSSFGSSGYSDLLLLQSHLRELQIERAVLSDIQRADVLITQQWLRLVFWQAALKLGYISTVADDRAFTYDYPVDIALAMCEVVKSLPPVAIQVHGLGIFEKQFEVAYSLMDTIALSGTAQPEHHECLRYLLLSLSASPNSRQIYVRTLEKKMGGSQKYRNLAGVQLLRDDGTSRSGSRRQSLVATAQQK